MFNKSVGIDFSFWVEQAGGHIYDEDTETVLIDTPEVKEAYEFIVSMIKEKIAKIEFEEGYITGPLSRKEAFRRTTGAFPDHCLQRRLTK